MSVLAGKHELSRPAGTEAARQSGRVILILSCSILGVAATYFGALYLIAR